ncbi:hypothetical protein D3C85_1285780 [compost metagenome]
MRRVPTSVTPAQTMIKVATGISNARPKARNRARMKSRYRPMSVIIATPSGVTLAKKPNIIGKTTKKAKAMPE